MKRFDIYDAQVIWNACPDRRPWLIVEIIAPGAILGCFPISGQNYRGSGFYIPMDDPDFAATGLKKSCYILDEAIIELTSKNLIRRRGHLENDLLKRFRKFSGI
jgi:hypothetical protein